MYFNSHRLEQDRLALIEILQQLLCLAVAFSGFWIFSQFSQFSALVDQLQPNLESMERALSATVPTWLLTLPLLMYLAYLGLRLGVRRLWEACLAPRKAVIVGANSVGLHLSQQLRQKRALNLEFCGFFDWQPAPDAKISRQQYLGNPKQLLKYISNHQVDIVYIAIPNREETLISELLHQLKNTTACVYLIPNIAGVNLLQSQAYNLNGLPMLAAWEIPFSGLQSLLKRGLDLLVAGLALLLLSPLLLLIAGGVKLSSPGPVLFKQRRHGMNGQEILVYKFRSMRVMENGAAVQQARRGDPRVTKFGAFLRKTSLDELPQFINVLQGQMSVVGPRPHAIAHNDQYRQQIDGYMLRHKVKPGITGWAQINGYRGETDTLDKMRKRIEYDLHYLQHWSLGLDLQIVLRTAFVFFQTKNVY
jgi:putative colanic acid biosysnthesis UDP-glucose lipid carrier transferase